MPDHWNLAEATVKEPAERHPEKLALLFEGRELQEFRYGDVYRQVAAWEELFWDEGLRAGDRVLLRLPSGPCFAFGFLAAASVGLVAVPLSPQLSAREVEFIAEDTEARALFTSGELPEVQPWGCHQVQIEALFEVELGGPLPRWRGLSLPMDTAAYMVYTSGTCGRPKGVLHSHGSVWGRKPMFEGWTGMGGDDIVLHAGQLNWTYTLGVGLLDPLSVGATSVLYGGPKDPTAWARLIEEHGVSLFAAVPSVYRQMLKYTEGLGRKCGSLRHGLTAGEALSPGLRSRWMEATGVELYEALGMSECSTYISCGPNTPVVPGSPGRPQAGRRVAILPLDDEAEQPVAPGEIGVLAIHRSEPGLMLGYWHRLEEQLSAFRGDWFLTGDLAHQDEQGYIWFHGRDDEQMNALGYRVSPREVEQVLEQHPRLREVAVAELPVEEGLSIIAAFVVADEGFCDADALLRWCDERLARYKCPKQIRFVAALPRTPSGKLRRKGLREIAD